MKTPFFAIFACIHTTIATVLTLSSASQGQALYWDTNGTAASFGNFAGAWNGTNQLWNSDATGGAGGSLTATPTSSNALVITGGGATGIIALSTAATAASLDLANTANYAAFRISNGGSLALTGALTDTGAGSADVYVQNTTEANAATTLTASSVTTSVLDVTGASGGSAQFFTTGYDITLGTQYSIGGGWGTANTTIRQTAGTVTVTNPADRGFVFFAPDNFASSNSSSNRYILEGGTMKANRIGIANNDGNNNTTNRWARDARLEFNNGTLQSFNNGTLLLQNNLTFNTYDGTGTKDMGYNTSKPITVELSQTGTHTFNADGASSTILVTPSAQLVNKSGNAGTVTKTGLGALVFTGGNPLAVNSYTGGTTVSAGTMSTDYTRIAASAATGGTDNLSNGYSAGSQLILNGGDYTMIGRQSAAASSVTGISLNANAGGMQVNVGSTANLVIGQSITNANLPTGTYIRRIINGTTIELSSMSTSITNQTGQTLNFGAANFNNTQTINNVAVSANATVTVTPGAGSSSTLLGFVDVSGTGGLTKAGAGTLQLTGAVTHDGTIAINAGTLEFASASNATLTKTISGSGTLVKSGAGTLTIDHPSPGGNGGFNGAIIVNGGTLVGSSAAKAFNNQAITYTINSGGVVESLSADAFGFNSAFNNVTINAGGTLQGAAQQINALTLNGGLINGTGDGQNGVNYSLREDVTVGGTSASTIQGTQGIALNGQEAAAGGTRTFDVADATGNANADLIISTAVKNGYATNRLTNLAKTGAGTLLLSGANTYTGDTTVLDGTLSLASANLADTSTVTVADGAVLNLTHGDADRVGTLVIGNATYTSGSFSAATHSPFISGSGSIQVGPVFVDVSVPKRAFSANELFVPLKTFSRAEIGASSTFAAMHRGHLVISGGGSGSDSGRLTTWRLSQEASPNAVNPNRVGDHENNSIFKSHGMGFVGENVQIRSGKFQLYDLTNPALPAVQGSAFAGASSSHSSCRHGRYIYTGGEGYGTASGYIDIWNVANPANLQLIRSIDIPTITGFRCASVYALGNVLVVTASLTNGIATFDLSDPENPQLLDLDRSDTGATTYTSYLSGDKVYGGGQQGGFFVYNIADPRNIFVESRITPGGLVRYPVLQDEFIHVGNIGSGSYQKIRINTNPPQVVADVPGFPNAEIAIPIGNLVFVGTVASDSPDSPSGWLIPHDTVPDNRAPAINAIRPRNGESNVATTTGIGVSFTDLLDTPSITSATVAVRPVGGSAITGTYSNMGGIVNFTPNAALTTGTTYEVVVTAGGVRDSQGNAVTTTTTSRFSTGSTVDTTSLGLVLHYPLDETAGAVADDLVGTRDGLLTNFTATPWINTSSVGRGALSFDGVDDFVATTAFDTGAQFSVSSYIFLPSGTGGLHTIAANGGAGSATQGWKILVHGSTDVAGGRVQIETGNGTVSDAATTATGALAFDKWVHLAVTVDRAAGAARIWIDGRDVTADASIRNDFSTTLAMNWGCMTSNTSFLNGDLDDARIYNRLLGAADVEQLRDLSTAPRAHWRLNTSTLDSSPHGRDLVLSAGATFDTTSTAEGAAALSLDGVNGSAQSPVMELGSGFTVSAWVKIASGTGGSKTIVANGPSGYAGDGWNLSVTGSVDANAGRVLLETGDGTTGNDAHTPSGAFAFDRWTHIAVGVDRAAGVARIYVDGVDRTEDESVRNDFKTNAPLDLGQTSNGMRRLGGQLDDVRILGRWLEDYEIATLAAGRLLNHWPVDNDDRDESGYGRTLTRTNGAAFAAQSIRGTHALNYDGVDDHAFGPAHTLGQKFSLSLWAKLPAGLAAGSRTLVANSPGGATTSGFRWFVNSQATGDMAIHFETANGSLADNATVAAGTYVPDQWNHLAAVVDRAAGRVEIYLNRRRVTVDPTIRTDFANDLALHAGSLTGGGAPWQGQLDELRVYDEAISDADIAALGFGSPNLAPVIGNLTSTNGAATTGSSVTFTVTASDQNVGERLQYRFDFGGGALSAWQTGNTAAHTFTTPGRHVVTVSVSDGTTTTTRTMTQIIYNSLTALPPSISAEIAYDASRNKVWCITPDGDDHDNNTGTAPQGRVVRFDAVTRAVNNRVNLGANAEPVALAIRPGNAEVWVACKRSGQIKVINAGNGSVSATLTVGRGYQPVGVAFAPDGSAAFVVTEGAESLQKWSPSSRSKLAEIDLGATPRGLAVAADSSRVLVTRFRSPDAQGEVWERRASDLALIRTFGLASDTTTLDGPSAARGVANYLSQIVISPDGRKAWLPAKKDNIFRGVFRDNQPLSHESTVRALVAQLDLTANTELIGNRIDLDNSGLPVAACFSPRGDLAFVAIIAGEQIAVIDTNSRATLPAISTANGAALVGAAPSGLCVSPDGTKLFAHNFLERTVRVFDISTLTAGTGSTAPLLGTVALLNREPLTTTVLNGKKLFYNSNDPRLALEGYISCASCHLGGDHDGRTWDITHLGEGLRNTIDLRGHAGMSHGPLHWSANFNEVQDFENQIRDLGRGTGLIVGAVNPPLGAANAGRSAELDSLAAYVASLNLIPASPFRNSNGTLTTAATAGQTHFSSKGCATCHSGTNFTDSALSTFARHNIGTIDVASGSRLGGTLDGLDTPTLRGSWATPPYLHRGQAADLIDIFNTTNAPGVTNHARFRELSTVQQNELIRYLLEIE